MQKSPAGFRAGGRIGRVSSVVGQKNKQDDQGERCKGQW